ncbi:protein screw [Teleopsis dalmanni]|uniref:protein screw n=1 Tax=Teleopsis dalmanni TaxID=139649 RepID=UPI0018CCB143|nr:protein screw [Teleopsis dalmanni]
MRNSASKFLMDVYNELSIETGKDDRKHRHKRSIENENFITKLDRYEIENCNNVVTFKSESFGHNQPTDTKSLIKFNIRDVPYDLELLHSTIRLYQDPQIGKYSQQTQNTTITIYQRLFSEQNQKYELVSRTSINSTTTYKGWLEFNITKLLEYALHYGTLQDVNNDHDILVGVTIESEEIFPNDIGIVGPNVLSDLQPFVIGFFNGRDTLFDKIQKLRVKRALPKTRARTNHFSSTKIIYELPKTCTKLNFTVDFDQIKLGHWVIAPKKFDAYLCGGECNFPLGSQMNATNHAIVQTLMHLKKPNLPKPRCVPTVLDSISILHYINEDSFNLSKYPRSVVRQCGCH